MIILEPPKHLLITHNPEFSQSWPCDPVIPESTSSLFSSQSTMTSTTFSLALINSIAKTQDPSPAKPLKSFSAPLMFLITTSTSNPQPKNYNLTICCTFWDSFNVPVNLPFTSLCLSNSWLILETSAFMMMTLQPWLRLPKLIKKWKRSSKTKSIVKPIDSNFKTKEPSIKWNSTKTNNTECSKTNGVLTLVITVARWKKKSDKPSTWETDQSTTNKTAS